MPFFFKSSVTYLLNAFSYNQLVPNATRSALPKEGKNVLGGS